MIGRDRELEVLTGIWERVTHEGRAQFVTVFGPPASESRAWGSSSRSSSPTREHVRCGAARRRTGEHAVQRLRQLVKQTATIFDSDEPEDARAKLVASVAGLAGPAAAEEHAPQLELLLGLGDERTAAQRETIFFSARVFVESLAMTTPTLLLFEDIHWADASQLDLLEMLAARVRDVPVLVALARPELLTDRPTWGGGLPAYTSLQLDPLSEASSQELAEQLLSAKAVENGAAAVVEMAEETHCSSKSSRRSPRGRRRISCRPACGRSSRRSSIAFRSTSGASSWTHRSPGACSGVVRSRRWEDTTTSRPA